MRNRCLGCIAGPPTFLELLQRAKRVVQEAIQHADVPFARVVEAARVPRSTAYTPLFQTMMTVQAAVRGTQMAGAAVALASLEVGGMEEVRCRDARTNLAGLCVAREPMLTTQATAEVWRVRPQPKLKCRSSRRMALPRRRRTWCSTWRRASS